MWVLECSGDDLEGKKLWIRPGKKFVFGRTKNNEIGEVVVISHKTISRKHLLVEISQPSIHDCGNPYIRSKITIKDFDTKIGTILNGKQIRGQCVELNKESNQILLGRYEKSYFINWVPVTLTFSFSTREDKTKPYAKLYKTFAPLDVKILVNYEHDHTTHVVAKKRNTAKGLQALIDGRYIVHNDSFINALVVATSKIDGKCSLEYDFEGNLPDPIQYLPPRGDEPTQRDEVAYAPNTLRKSIFNGYSFVFYERRQYDNLFPPITAGCGEAILQIVSPNQTTVGEFVRFVNDFKAERRLGKIGDGGKDRRIVVVKFNPSKGSNSEWYVEFANEVALQLNFRLIEQNEFLDAILANDASSLWRSLQTDDLKHTEALVKSPTLKIPPSDSLDSLSTKEKVSLSAPRQNIIRRTNRPKFTGFDDDFVGPSVKPSSNLVKFNTAIATPKALEACASESQVLFASHDINHVSKAGEIQTQNPVDRKRKAPPILEEVGEIERLVGPSRLSPELKRRRLDIDIEIEPKQKVDLSSNLIENFTAMINVQTTKKDVAKKQKSTVSKLISQVPRKKCNDIDAEVEEMFQQKLERDKATAHSLTEAKCEYQLMELNTLEVTEIRNKIQIEEIQVRKLKRIERNRDEDGARWNESWNGRKNFKKFRRHGATKRISEKVIVQLKEVKKRDYAVFDDFLGEISYPRTVESIDKEHMIPEQIIWDVQAGLSTIQQTCLSKSRSREIPSIRTLDYGNSISSNKSQHQSKESILNTRSVTSSAGTSSAIQSQLTNDSTKIQSSFSNDSFSLKRATPHTLTRCSRNKPLAKKQKTISIKTVREESDDGSDDELKFRFKKK